MLLRQKGMQSHEIGATLLATFVSELKKSYALCHFITKYFLLQTTLNSISKSFSTKYQNWVPYLFRIRLSNYILWGLGTSFFSKSLVLCVLWTDFIQIVHAIESKKRKISDRFSISWKKIFFLNYSSVSNKVWVKKNCTTA